MLGSCWIEFIKNIGSHAAVSIRPGSFCVPIGAAFRGHARKTNAGIPFRPLMVELDAKQPPTRALKEPLPSEYWDRDRSQGQFSERSGSSLDDF